MDIQLSIIALISLVAGAVLWMWRKAKYIRSTSSDSLARVQIGTPVQLRGRVFGRQNELSNIHDSVRNGNPVIVFGTAGIGKSTLGRALAGELPPLDYRQVWIGCKENTNFRTILERLADHIKDRYGETGLLDAINRNGKDVDEWVDIVTDCLSKDKYVFFLDDFHLVQDGMVSTKLLPRLSNWATVVIMTREMTDELRGLQKDDPSVHVVRLGGLSEPDALDLLHQKRLADVPDALLKELIKKVRGHPKALDICAGLVHDAKEGSSIEELLRERLFDHDQEGVLRSTIKLSDKRLSMQERTALIACAVIDEPFSCEMLERILGSPDDSLLLHGLVDRSLVDKDTEGLFTLHPLIQEYYLELGRQILSIRDWQIDLSRLSFLFTPFFWRNRRLDCRLHERVARYYLEQRADTQSDRWRIVFHLHSAFKLREAAELEGITLEVRKHRLAVFSQLELLFVSIAVVVIAVLLILPFLAGTGWRWVMWIDAFRFSIAVILISLGTATWFYIQWFNVRHSWIAVTQEGSLYVFNSTWLRYGASSRLLRWIPTPGYAVFVIRRNWTGRYSVALMVSNPLLRRLDLGYIYVQRTANGENYSTNGFGPVWKPGKTVEEIRHAIAEQTTSALSDVTSDS